MNLLARSQQLPPATVTAIRQMADRARSAASTSNGLIKGTTWESALLDAYIFKLREVGWTLQAIGDALGISRERARQRCDNATDAAYQSGELPEVPDPPLKPRKVSKPRMRPAFIDWLRQIYPVANRCRGTHAVGSPERVASEQLWAAINEAMAQGISGADIARVLGVSVRTIYAGLKRHGHRKQSPSQSLYIGTPPQLTGTPRLRTHCKRGHEFTPENTYICKQGRLCRKCAQERRRRDYERAKAKLATVTDLSERRLA